MLFDKGRLFDAYCLMGLCNSFTAKEGDLRQLLAAENYDLAELLQYTDRVERERGIELVVRTETGAIRAVL
jgi:hypothetical protein